MNGNLIVTLLPASIWHTAGLAVETRDIALVVNAVSKETRFKTSGKVY